MRRTSKHACWVAWVILSTLGLAAADPADCSRPRRIRLHVEIDPQAGTLAAEAGLVLAPGPVPAETISFDLHETFRVTALRINGQPADFSIEPNPPLRVRPASSRVSVRVPGKPPWQSLTLEIEYHGALKNIPEWGATAEQAMGLDDRLGPGRVELASYSCWYPFWRFGERFDVELSVLLPAEWTVVASGRLQEEEVHGGRRLTRWQSVQDLDIVVLASPEFRQETIRAGAGEVRLYHTRLPEDFIRREAAQMSATLDLFTRLLGDPVSPRNLLRQVYSPRQHGQGGYARPGIIVTSEGRVAAALAERPDMTFLRGNAHEIAHFCWHFGRGQGDWINESLAEYFGLVAVERLQGPERLATYLDRYRETVAGLPAAAPALAAVPADNEGDHYVIRYTKGALFCHALRAMLGDERFFAACREFHQRYAHRSVDTGEFRAFWAAADPAAEALMSRWLDGGGGLPDSPPRSPDKSPAPMGQE